MVMITSCIQSLHILVYKFSILAIHALGQILDCSNNIFELKATISFIYSNLVEGSLISTVCLA